jgi:hypothetical protein
MFGNTSPPYLVRTTVFERTLIGPGDTQPGRSLRETSYNLGVLTVPPD